MAAWYLSQTLSFKKRKRKILCEDKRSNEELNAVASIHCLCMQLASSCNTTFSGKQEKKKKNPCSIFSHNVLNMMSAWQRNLKINNNTYFYQTEKISPAKAIK